MDLLAHPAVQSVGVPLAVVAVALAVLGRGRGAGLAIGVATLAAVAAIVGLRPWPPLSALHKLTWLAGLVLALGAANDALRLQRPARLAVAWAFAAGAFAWLAWPQRASATGSAVVAWIALLAAIGWLLASLAARERPAPVPAVLLAVAGAGLAVVAFQSASLVLAQLAAALAVAAGAFASWSVVAGGVRFAPGSALGAGGLLALLLMLTALLTDAPTWALLALPAAFLAERVVTWRAGTQSLPGRALRAALLAAVAALPAALAVALATWLRPADSPYY